MICERFGCVPSVAEREWMTADEGWIAEVMEAGSFAEAYDAYASADLQTQRKLKGRTFERIREIEFAEAAAEIEATQRDDA